MAVSPATSEPLQAGIDAQLWDRFAHAGDAAERDRCWLDILAALVPGARLAALVRVEEDGRLEPVVLWPQGVSADALPAGLLERVADEGCGLVTRLPAQDGGSLYGVAHPVFEDERLDAIVAVVVEAGDEQALKTVMGQLHWGSAWQELFTRRRTRARDRALQTRLSAAMNLLAAVLSRPACEAAAMALVTELATLLDCTRVSLGFTDKGYARVYVISHSARFGKRMNLVRAIGAAMDEALDQRQDIMFPLPEGRELPLTRDHARLAELSGSTCIMTVPVHGGHGYYAAVTLERETRPFDEDELRLVQSVAGLAGPALEDKRRNDRWIGRKVFDAAARQWRRLVGPRHAGRKLAVATLASLVLFFSFAEGDYRVSGDVVLEGAMQRVVSAPFAGYVQTAPVRAGDRVEAGELLATLDDQELRLERLRWSSQRNQLQRQYQEALAQHDRSQVSIISAQIEQAEAQLALVESKLGRTRLTAPFDGLVVSGDLSQRLGSAVQQGETLFELAPLDAYRVILMVSEQRIADLAAGQRGVLVLTALPDETHPFRVTRITPVAEARDGENRFRVEAELEEISPRLRPGMEGVGKVFVDRRLLIGIWTRGLWDWLRLQWWVWRP